MSTVLYLIGSLRNDRIPKLAKKLRADHPEIEVFDDWYSAGREADDYWKTYEQDRGRTYEEALAGYAARHVFSFDKFHLDRATHVLLVLPAGKSGHMEVMYAEYGTKAKTAILLDPEDVRWDVMYQFIPTVLNTDGEIADWLSDPVQKFKRIGKDTPSIGAGKIFSEGYELVTGGGSYPWGISNGGWAPGLLPERLGRGGQTFETSRRKAYSWGTPPLETSSEHRPQKQNPSASGRHRKKG